MSTRYHAIGATIWSLCLLRRAQFKTVIWVTGVSFLLLLFARLHGQHSLTFHKEPGAVLCAEMLFFAHARIYKSWWPYRHYLDSDPFFPLCSCSLDPCSPLTWPPTSSLTRYTAILSPAAREPFK